MPASNSAYDGSTGIRIRSLSPPLKTKILVQLLLAIRLGDLERRAEDGVQRRYQRDLQAAIAQIPGPGHHQAAVVEQEDGAGLDVLPEVGQQFGDA